MQPKYSTFIESEIMIFSGSRKHLKWNAGRESVKWKECFGGALHLHWTSWTVIESYTTNWKESKTSCRKHGAWANTKNKQGENWQVAWHMCTIHIHRLLMFAPEKARNVTKANSTMSSPIQNWSCLIALSLPLLPFIAQWHYKHTFSVHYLQIKNWKMLTTITTKRFGTKRKKTNKKKPRGITSVISLHQISQKKVR